MTDKKSRDIIFSLSDGNHAEVAELADALDSKSSVVTLRAGSSPAFGTTCKFKALRFFRKAFFVIYDGGNLMFRPMRRKRQNLTTDQCQQILAKGKQGVLATLGDDDYPYAVPVNYVYYQNKIYIHCVPYPVTKSTLLNIMLKYHLPLSIKTISCQKNSLPIFAA